MGNEEQIERFMRIKRVNGQSEETITNQERILRQVSQYFNKPFKEANEEDLLRFLTMKKYSPSTMKIYIAIIKNFYRFLYGMKRGHYPPLVENLKVNNSKQRVPIRPEQIITKRDIAQLIKFCGYYRDEAIVVTLYESGCRLGEFVNINIEDVHYDHKGIVIVVSGKTGQRRIRLIESVPYIQKWIENHPTKDEPSSPLWCTLRHPYRRVNPNTIYILLKSLKRKSGIKKPLNPHAFRHSRLTELSKYLSDAKLKVFAGWTGSSTMAGVYVHLSGQDLDNDLLEIAGVKPKKEKPKVSPLREIECPRCRNENPANNMFCGLCGLVLNEQEVLKEELDAQTKIAKMEEEIGTLRNQYETAGEITDQLSKTIDELTKEVKELKKQH